jgi:uncharacterized coiled-coil DUF342 family protein
MLDILDMDTPLGTKATLLGTLTILAGVLIKYIESKISNRSTLDDHAILRKELRDELDSVRTELRDLRNEVDEWRDKYYSQVETTNELLFEVAGLKARLYEYESHTDTHRIRYDD